MSRKVEIREGPMVRVGSDRGGWSNVQSYLVVLDGRELHPPLLKREAEALARKLKPRRSRSTQPGGLALRGEQEKEADELWRRIIYSKTSGGLCARCGRSRGLQAMHFVSRRKRQTRWEVSNGQPGCPACHWEMGMDHDKHMAFFVGKIGQAEADRLLLLSESRGGKVDMTLVLLDLHAEARKRGLE